MQDVREDGNCGSVDNFDEEKGVNVFFEIVKEVEEYEEYNTIIRITDID